MLLDYSRKTFFGAHTHAHNPSIEPACAQWEARALANSLQPVDLRRLAGQAASTDSEIDTRKYLETIEYYNTIGLL